MASVQDVGRALRTVMDPELHENLVDLGMIRRIRMDPEGHHVSLILALTVASCPLADQLVEQTRSALMKLPGVEEVTIETVTMTPEELERLRRRLRDRQIAPPAAPAAAKRLPPHPIGRVLAVLSGKGGVGKSTVTGLLALGLARQGRRVGILDADVTGPSIPRLFGLPAGAAGVEGGHLVPAVGPEGIRVMSVNLILPAEDTAVIWRGPLVAKAIQQFWTDVEWGELDELVVDLPPGTSDAALTVMQELPLDGVVVVTTPQDLAAMVVRKAVNMAKKLNVSILGVVENMSTFICPETGKPYELFGPGHAAELAAQAGAPVIARLPVDPQLASLCDSGRLAAYRQPLVEEMAGRIGSVLAAGAARPAAGSEG